MKKSFNLPYLTMVMFSLLLFSCSKESIDTSFESNDTLIFAKGGEGEKAMAAAAAPIPSCNCLFWIKSDRKNSNGNMLNTWLSAFSYEETDGTTGDIRFGGGNQTHNYIVTNQWKKIPFTTNNFADFSLNSIGVVEVDNLMETTYVNVKVTCTKANASYPNFAYNFFHDSTHPNSHFTLTPLNPYLGRVTNCAAVEGANNGN